MRIAALVGLLWLAGPAAAAEPDWGPWKGRWGPVEGTEADVTRPPDRVGLFEGAYRWYRARSQQDGARCPYYPTCSGYGITAVRAWGPFAGGMLTVDRLLREYPGMANVDHYPLVTPHETPRLYDPVPLPRRLRDDGQGRGAR